MKPLPALAVAALTVASAIPVAATAQETGSDARRGRKIVEEAERRDTGWGDMSARVDMILREADGRERQHQLRILTLEGNEDGDRTLVTIESPRDIRGTALLTHAHPDGPNDQWIYLPALRRVKRVAAAGRTASFLGSEFTYEDLGVQEIDRFEYRVLDIEKIEGVQCARVERTPLEADSESARQVLWFDLEAYRVMRVEYFDAGGEPIKTLDVTGYRAYGAYWRADRMLMTNHRSGRSTTLSWQDVQFGAGLTERDFDRRALDRAR
jgi:outer membrane lipoprotein-sorting protein